MSFTVGSMDSNSFNTLFSSLTTTSSTSSTGIESLLSDYNSLSTGSYGKLLKSYYNKFDSVNSKSDTGTSSEKTSLSETKNDAEDLIESADKLLSKATNSVWKKVEVENEDGSKTTDYDKSKIYDAVSKFVNDYNALVDSGQKSNNTGVLTQVASMVTNSNSSSTTLGKVGITVDSKNHLSIDETYFKEKADMTSVKSLFNGTGSYAYQIATKASMVKSYSSSNLANMTGLKNYSNNGSYSISSADLMSSLNTEV